MAQLIPKSVAEKAIEILTALNRGYWESLYWEFQDDEDAFFVRVSISEAQNNTENIKAISWILRVVLAPIIPSNEHGLSWCGSIVYKGQSIGGATGGWRDDWKTLGTNNY